MSACGVWTVLHTEMCCTLRCACLVEEQPPKMVAIREYIRLAWQIGAAAVHKVNAWQTAGLGNLLKT